MKDYTRVFNQSLLKKVQPLLNKLDPKNIPAVLPIKIKSESNIFNLRLRAYKDDIFVLWYEPFYKPTEEDKSIMEPYKFYKEHTAFIVCSLCEVLLDQNVVEVGDDLNFKGNVSIAKTYSTLSKLGEQE